MINVGITGMKNKSLDKFKGCLIGGAVGDALGYAVEFLNIEQIKKFHGEKGITEYELIDGKALISDDTQMTLFTANGLLLGTTRGMIRGMFCSYPYYIWLCYKDWLKTQEPCDEQPNAEYAWLYNVPELNHSRAPGNTCLSAIAQDKCGTIQEPINNSKGCGGLMRVAPIGLYFIDKWDSQDVIDMLGAEAAALTHGHELGYIPAALLVHIISLVSSGTTSLEDAIQDGLKSIVTLFPSANELNNFIGIINKAVYLSKCDFDDLSAISQLGEGWVAEETLAIAIYCSLKYQKDFEKAIIAAVNHSGDSDSTGSVTGNILGAYLGINAIPDKFIKNLELKDLIEDIATDLFNDCKASEFDPYIDVIWVSKYIHHDYNFKPNN